MPKREQGGPRPLRVGEELRHALARLFEAGRLHDPDLAGLAITVSEVRVAPDLKHATVFVMPLGGARVEAAMAALQRAAGFLRHELAQEVELRAMPALHFELDNSFEHASHIDALLHRPEVERDLAPKPADDEPKK